MPYLLGNKLESFNFKVKSRSDPYSLPLTLSPNRLEQSDLATCSIRAYLKAVNSHLGNINFKKLIRPVAQFPYFSITFR